MLASHLEKERGFVMLKCSLKEPVLARRPDHQIETVEIQDTRGHPAYGPDAFLIGCHRLQCFLKAHELGRQIGDDIMRSRTYLHGTEAQITHGAKLKGNTEPSGVRSGTDQ